jgi:class 3 adenylate cyclase
MAKPPRLATVLVLSQSKRRMTETRRLAAILVADVVAYSALTGAPSGGRRLIA